MRGKKYVFLPIVAFGLAIQPTSGSAATLINFESGYSDNQLLSDDEALLDSDGNASNVFISTVNENTMSLEASGSADGWPQGFVNDPMGTIDTESVSATSSLDGFFLRSTEALKADLAAVNPVFTLSFLGGASTVSGEIWDIDGNLRQGSEGWEVIATYKDGHTSSIFSPVFMNYHDATSLNGQAWTFTFNTVGNNILSLDFMFTGSKTYGIGVAFDNLTVATVPLPAGGLLLLAGLGALGALRRRKV